MVLGSMKLSRSLYHAAITRLEHGLDNELAVVLQSARDEDYKSAQSAAFELYQLIDDLVNLVGDQTEEEPDEQ